MRIDFYHIDGMEAPNYVPVWRELRRMGVDARLVTVPDPHNTASRGWFDFDATTSRYRQQGVEYSTDPDYDCDLAVTTQAPKILAPYRGLKIRMMYGPSMLSDSFSHSREASERFDAVLVHGKYSQRRVARWMKDGGVLIGGHPKCDDFFLRKYEGHKAQYRSQYPGRRPIVSYLPTWADASSIDLFLEAVAGLHDRYDVLIKPHHCTIRREGERLKRIGDCGAKVILDASELTIMYALSDLVMADVRSGAFYEAIALGVPVVALTANPADTAKHLDPRALAAAPLCANPADLPHLAHAMLTADRYAEARAKLADDLVSFRDGTAARHAADAIVEFVERARVRPAAAPRQADTSAPATGAKVMPFKPRVRPSIVLPTYNHLKYLPLAIESVLTQTYQDFELIIVNDGSTDGTREFLDRLKDPRITVIHQQNTRLPGALNTGMRAATGDLVTWISSDNWCAPTFLETLMAAFVAYPDAGFVSSAYANIDEDGRILNIHRNPDYSLHSMMSVNPGTASFMYRRACHDAVGFYDPELEGAEDWDMWLRIHERYKFVYVPDVLYYYRVHANSMSGQIRPKIMEKSRETIANLYARNKSAFDIMRVYPDIAHCTNKARAAKEALFDFGSSLLRSPFNPIAAAVRCLEESRRLAPSDRHVAINLGIAYGRAGRFEDAARVAKDALTNMAGASHDPELRSIMRACNSQSQSAFKEMPVHVLEKSRSELFRVEAAARLIYTHHSGVPVRAAAMSRSPV